MKRLATVIAFAALAFVVASCADNTTPTAPVVSENSLSSVSLESSKSGGKASPHFEDVTKCMFYTETGHLACDYMVTGLGKYGHAVITLAGDEEVTYTCNTTERTRGRLYLQIDIWGDKSGNYKGHIDAPPLFGPICFGSLTNVSWALGDDWLLDGLAITAAGPPVAIISPPPTLQIVYPED